MITLKPSVVWVCNPRLYYWQRILQASSGALQNVALHRGNKFSNDIYNFVRIHYLKMIRGITGRVTNKIIEYRIREITIEGAA